jgi:protein-L-isoaspartate(D-aspartate) O-methyltransferase
MEKRPIAYAGEHIDLGNGRVLLDARTFAKMLDAVNVQPSELVLDIGCGMGYSSAILAKMSEAVVAIESDKDMAATATETLMEQSVDNAYVAHADLTQGNAKNGPYDVIMLQGAVEEIPSSLTDQLKEGGRICAIFQDANLGECRLGYKNNNKISWRSVFNATAPILDGFEAKPEFKFA